MVNSREQRRMSAILKTKATLKKLKIWGESSEPYKEKIILEIMSEFFTSRRTAIEYFDTAELMIEQDWKKEEEDKAKAEKEAEEVLNGNL